MNCLLSTSGLRVPTALADSVVLRLTAGARDDAFDALEQSLLQFARCVPLSPTQCAQALTSVHSSLMQIALSSATPTQLLDTVACFTVNSVRISVSTKHFAPKFAPL